MGWQCGICGAALWSTRYLARTTSARYEEEIPCENSATSPRCYPRVRLRSASLVWRKFQDIGCRGMVPGYRARACKHGGFARKMIRRRRRMPGYRQQPQNKPGRDMWMKWSTRTGMTEVATKVTTGAIAVEVTTGILTVTTAQRATFSGTETRRGHQHPRSYDDRSPQGLQLSQ